MWLIVGLGNPGTKYSCTRHNAGFMAIDYIAHKHNLIFDNRFDGLIAKANFTNQETLLFKPLTYMNLSGRAVKKVLSKFYLSPANLIVIHDDIDIECGRIKIKKGGSSGGHNGVESIITELATKDFIRIKIGVDRGDPVDEYVLRPFTPQQNSQISVSVPQAAEAAITIITEGITKAFNAFNKSPKRVNQDENQIKGL